MRLGCAFVAAAALVFVVGSGPTEAAAPAYQQPPAPIPAMLDAAPTPSVSVSRDRKTMAIFGRENLPSVAALARPILRLGGYRIDPRTNGPAEIRMNWLTSLSFEDIATGKVRPVALPAGLRFAQPEWSPDGKRVAFVVRAPIGLELWTASPNGGAKKLTGPVLNGAFGMAAAYQWLPDSSGFVIARKPAGRGAAPPDTDVPGPTIQESAGKKATVRTYEDLLANPHDEALFDYYFSYELARVDLATGAERRIGAPGLFIRYGVSPDGKYLHVERLKRPYSYLVPAARFPAEIAIWSIDGRPVKTVAERALQDNLPAAFDAVEPVAREVEWRADAPATLAYAVAQDGGDSDRKTAHHDALMTLEAPFTGEARPLISLEDRFARVIWGRSDTALVVTRRIKTRRETWFVVDPSGKAQPHKLFERNYQSQYNNPGAPILVEGPYGRPVMAFTPDRAAVLVSAPGATREGEQPFLAWMNLTDGQETKLWQADANAYETPVAVIDGGKSFVTRRESATEPPNYWIHVGAAPARELTHFTDPEPQFARVQKSLITYKRADGVALSGTLYLPAGYDKARDGPLPMLMWAYPTEFTDASVAGQVVDREKNRFNRPQGISHLFMVTQGYAVLDGPSFPIIGENGKEPNDTYIDQLTADAQAAVDAVVAMGVTDRDHIAVGGHSYGAFMTANLLAHTNLFRAGIARSGAYNRTLTPFGFQNEQRTFWQAEDVYNRMSPFNYATSVKAPILLIHGEADDNSGTFPIQSERFYAALKGAGATVRYVTLPNEPHGYRGRESTGHVLWEMTNWLDRYVKHAPPRGPQTTSTQ